MKIVAVVSSFYPNIDELEVNINSYLPWVDRLIIWENSSRADSQVDSLIARLHNDKVEVMTTGKNEYLAEPFNKCIGWAKDNGSTHLMTMDQDSCFADGHFEKYLRLIEAFPDKNVAVFGPSSNSRISVNLPATEVTHTFISGAVFPLEILLQQGGFNLNLAIDSIDSEYCFRCKNSGFQTIVFRDVFLQHQLGYRYKHWTGLTIVPYSAQRTYYFIRNTLWLWEQYPQYFDKAYKCSFVKYRIIFRVFKIGFEKDSFKKLKAIFLAVSHYRQNRLGRFDF